MGDEVDLFGSINMIYDDNKIAMVSWNALAKTPEEWVITGTEGFIKILCPAHASEAIEVNINGKKETF